MRRRAMRDAIRELQDRLALERTARHEAELSAASARGELRGYRSAADQRVIRVREDARNGRELTI